LSLEETRGYIAERLRIAGANSGPIFSPEAIESIYHHARGIPRVINVLCEHALINSFADEQKLVTAAHVDGVAREFGLDSIEPTAPVDGSGAPDSAPSVETVLRDLATLLDQLRQPASVAIGSGKGNYEPYS